MNDNHKNEMMLARGLPMPTPTQPREPAVLTLKQAITAVFRSRRLLLATTSIGLLGGTWLALGQPNSYLSQGTFIIRPGGEQIVINPIANKQDKPVSQPLRANATAILQSDEVLKQTIRRLGAAYILAPYAPRLDPDEGGGIGATIRGWIYAFQRRMNTPKNPQYRDSDALLLLQDTLTVTAPKTTQVLAASVQANDPVRAQRILQVFMEEAQERHLEVYSAERSIREVETTYAAIKEKYAKTSKTIKQFLRKHDLQDFDADLALAQEAERNARIAVRTLTQRTQTNTSTLAGLKRRIQGLKPTLTVMSKVPVENVRLPVLRDQINTKQAELLDMEGRLQPSDKGITRLRTQLAHLQKELDAELAKPVKKRTETREEDNPAFLAARSEIGRIEIELVVDGEQLPAAKQTLALATQRTTKLLTLQTEYRTLARRLERTVTRLDDAEQMLVLARKKTELDKKRISSLQVLDKPNLPLVKEGPKRARIVLGGLIGGFFLGIALVLIRALTDSTVRTVDDLDELGTFKVLATIPNLDKTTVKRHENMRVTSWC